MTSHNNWRSGNTYSQFGHGRASGQAWSDGWASGVVIGWGHGYASAWEYGYAHGHGKSSAASGLGIGKGVIGDLEIHIVNLDMEGHRVRHGQMDGHRVW
jgi:hypothetical protein